MKSRFRPYAIALLVGFIAGLITLFIIPSEFEIFVWLVLILLISTYSQYQFEKYKYKKTFIISVLTGIVITLTHLYFINQYLLTHREEIQTLDKILITNSYRLTLFSIAPMYWIILGSLTVLMNLVIEKLIRTVSPNR